jgi:hypothetical protein
MTTQAAIMRIRVDVHLTAISGIVVAVGEASRAGNLAQTTRTRRLPIVIRANLATLTTVILVSFAVHLASVCRIPVAVQESAVAGCHTASPGRADTGSVWEVAGISTASAVGGIILRICTAGGTGGKSSSAGDLTRSRFTYGPGWADMAAGSAVVVVRLSIHTSASAVD